MSSRQGRMSISYIVSPNNDLPSPAYPPSFARFECNNPTPKFADIVSIEDVVEAMIQLTPSNPDGVGSKKVIQHLARDKDATHTIRSILSCPAYSDIFTKVGKNKNGTIYKLVNPPK